MHQPFHFQFACIRRLDAAGLDFGVDVDDVPRQRGFARSGSLFIIVVHAVCRIVAIVFIFILIAVGDTALFFNTRNGLQLLDFDGLAVGFTLQRDQ